MGGGGLADKPTGKQILYNRKSRQKRRPEGSEKHSGRFVLQARNVSDGIVCD
jgi:hypothetical protein